MTFLNPLVLFGLAAAALPVILHLLHRRRLRVVEFSTLRFLKEIQHSSLRRVKLRQWLLLLLRTALIVALVLAFARPVLRADLAGSAGPRAASAIVLLIDDSPSMSVRSSRGALFDQAKEVAARIIGTAAASDRVAVIPLSQSRTDSAAPQFQPPGSARAGAEAAAQSEASRPIAAGLAAAAHLLGTAQEANREVYLITDGQATQFREHPSDSLPVPPAGARMFIVHTPSGTTANAGVAGIRSLTRVRGVGRPAILAITLRNYGDAPIASLPVSIYLDGARVAQQAAAIPPRSTATVTLPVIPRRTGILTGAVKLEEDALDLDNSRSFVLTVPSESRITLAGPAGSGTRFARLALTLGGDSLVSGRIRLRDLPESQLPSADLASTDVLLLAGIDLLTPAQGSTITSFLRRGGSMMLFPGAAFDAASYRRNLWEPLSLPGWNPPAPPPAPAGNAAAPAQIASFARVDFDHPLFAGLFADDRRARNEGTVESPSIIRTAGQRPDPRGHPIITLTNGETFLAEYRAGGGTLFVFDVEAGTSWSDFPLKGIFAPILHRSAAYLSSFTEDDSAVAAGNPLTFRVRREFLAAGSSLRLRSPGNIDERVAPAAGRSGSEAVAPSITVPTIAAGTYRLFAVRPGDSTLVAARVAVIPESEGDLRALEQRELSSIAPVIQPSEELEGRIREARVGTELWLPFLLLAALLAVAEMWIAREQKEGNSSR